MSQSVNWSSIHIDDFTIIYRTRFSIAEKLQQYKKNIEAWVIKVLAEK